MPCVREEHLTDFVMGMILREKEVGLKPSIDEKCISPATLLLLQVWDQLTVYDRVLF